MWRHVDWSTVINVSECVCWLHLQGRIICSTLMIPKTERNNIFVNEIWQLSSNTHVELNLYIGSVNIWQPMTPIQLAKGPQIIIATCVETDRLASGRDSASDVLYNVSFRSRFASRDPPSSSDTLPNRRYAGQNVESKKRRNEEICTKFTSPELR
jgi:hypothetical protein